MERNAPVRKPHTSTADLLTWSEIPPAVPSPATAPRSTSHQPSDGISKVVFGGQVTDEEVESLNKRCAKKSLEKCEGEDANCSMVIQDITKKPCSGYKLKEFTGNNIFAAGAESDTAELDAANPTPTNKTGLRLYQQAVAGISHISFGEDETVSPKKPASLPEVKKQRELSGTLETEAEAEAKLKKQLSDAKCKELSGHDIFAPPPEIKPRPLGARALALRESITIGESTPHRAIGGPNNDINAEHVVKTSKKIPDKKFAELSGNDIFKGDAPPASDKSLSSAKLREMNGSNIFADGKVENRVYLGARKPPGGESSIALV